jgi:hypothetical protein
MHLTRYTEAAEFAGKAEPFLLQHEAENNVILGICSTLIHSPDPSRPEPYLAVVEDDGAIIAAMAKLPHYNLVLAHAEVDTFIPMVAENLRSTGYRDIPGVVASKGNSRAFAESWHSAEGVNYRLAISMRCYQLEAVQQPISVSGQMRRTEERDRDLLQQWLQEFHEEALGDADPATPEEIAGIVDRYLTPGNETLRGFLLWEDDGTVVSMAAYVGPTPHGMRVNSVYTPPEHRRRGYASACVAGVSQLILDSGKRFCFLFTDLANPASNKIYQDIGYNPVADVDKYLFEAHAI